MFGYPRAEVLGREIEMLVEECYVRTRLFKQPPAVTLTCPNQEAETCECYKLGANSYVQKPVEFDVFCYVIRNIEVYWLQVNLAPPPRGQNVKEEKKTNRK